MKRIIVGLLAAFLTFTGLVAVTSQPATAACPYTNCIATQTSSSGVRTDRNTVNYTVTVRSAGNTAPAGKVRIDITKYGSTRRVLTQTRRVARVSSNASRINFSTGNLAKGKYTVRFTFGPDSGTVFRSSSSARSLVIS